MLRRGCWPVRGRADIIEHNLQKKVDTIIFFEGASFGEGVRWRVSPEKWFHGDGTIALLAPIVFHT